MLFNSFSFLFGFLPIVLLGCFLLARYAGRGPAQFWLIGASLFFYAAWNAVYLPMLLGSIAFNYFIAIRMLNQEDAGTRRLLLILAVAGNLTLLGYYKYSLFF